jgi:enterochelin esterase-like enzyme
MAATTLRLSSTLLLAAVIPLAWTPAARAGQAPAPATRDAALHGAPRTADDTRDASAVAIDVLHVPAPGVAEAPLRVRVLRPPGYRGDASVGHAVLYVNDGQDAEAVQLARTLEALARDGTIRAPLVVAIDMPPDRIAAYGYSDRIAGRARVAPTRHGDVGAKAHAYSEWLATTLVPLIDARYRTRTMPDARAILGWSLGAAHAFNMGWQYPELFGRVGAFSPSFWLSTARGDAAAVQRTRIAQSMVHGTPPRNGARFFLAVGTAEEADDRDGDGINDALDDTRDLALGWNADAGGLKGLRQAGYRVDEHWTTRPRRRRPARARRRHASAGQLGAHAARLPALGVRGARAAHRSGRYRRGLARRAVQARRVAHRRRLAAAVLRHGPVAALSRDLHA